MHVLYSCSYIVMPTCKFLKKLRGGKMLLQKINIFRNFCQSFWVAQSQFVSTILPQNLYFYGRLGSLRLTEQMIFSSHHKVTNYCLPPLYFASDERSILRDDSLMQNLLNSNRNFHHYYKEFLSGSIRVMISIHTFKS